MVPKKAVPKEAPIERVKVTVLVATPISDFSTRFWETREGICIRVPKLSPRVKRRSAMLR